MKIFALSLSADTLSAIFFSLFIVYILSNQFGLIETMEDPYSGFAYIALIICVVFVLFLIWRYKKLKTLKESG